MMCSYKIKSKFKVKISQESICNFFYNFDFDPHELALQFSSIKSNRFEIYYFYIENLRLKLQNENNMTLLKLKRDN